MKQFFFAVIIVFSGNVFADVSVDEVVDSYLRKSLKAGRFKQPYSMEYHVKYDYPEERPKLYTEEAKYRHWVTQPKYRYEALIGPTMPMKQSPLKYEAVWDGSSEVDINYDDDRKQASVLVARKGVGDDRAKSNRFLSALGIPCTEQEQNEANGKSYFIENGVASSNGYFTSTTILNGLECVLLDNGNSDKLWFTKEMPFRLVQRDTWRNKGTPTHEIIRFENYGSTGLPEKIHYTSYLPVNKIGQASKILVVENFFLDKILFEPSPSNTFFVKIENGAQVLDLKSLQSFRVEDSTVAPYEKFLRLSERRQFPFASFEILLIVVGSFITLIALRNWNRRKLG